MNIYLRKIHSAKRNATKLAVSRAMFDYLVAQPRELLKIEKFSQTVLAKLVELEEKYAFDSRKYIRLLFTSEQEHAWRASRDTTLDSRSTHPDPDGDPSACSLGADNVSAPRLKETDDGKCCVVCLDAQRQTVLLPCRHLVMCDKCAVQCAQCPVCREPKAGVFDVFW